MAAKESLTVKYKYYLKSSENSPGNVSTWSKLPTPERSLYRFSVRRSSSSATVSDDMKQSSYPRREKLLSSDSGCSSLSEFSNLTVDDCAVFTFSPTATKSYWESTKQDRVSSSARTASTELVHRGSGRYRSKILDAELAVKEERNSGRMRTTTRSDRERRHQKLQGTGRSKLSNSVENDIGPENSKTGTTVEVKYFPTQDTGKNRKLMRCGNGSSAVNQEQQWTRYSETLERPNIATQIMPTRNSTNEKSVVLPAACTEGRITAARQKPDGVVKEPGKETACFQQRVDFDHEQQNLLTTDHSIDSYQLHSTKDSKLTTNRSRNTGRYASYNDLLDTGHLVLYAPGLASDDVSPKLLQSKPSTKFTNVKERAFCAEPTQGERQVRRIQCNETTAAETLDTVTFKIFIRNVPYTSVCKLDDSVRCLKTFIHLISGLPPRRQKFAALYRGREKKHAAKNENKTLRQLGFRAGEVIDVDID